MVEGLTPSIEATFELLRSGGLAGSLKGGGERRNPSRLVRQLPRL